jgi:hypothetical protein
MLAIWFVGVGVVLSTYRVDDRRLNLTSRSVMITNPNDGNSIKQMVTYILLENPESRAPGWTTSTPTAQRKFRLVTDFKSRTSGDARWSWSSLYAANCVQIAVWWH